MKKKMKNVTTSTPLVEFWRGKRRYVGRCAGTTATGYKIIIGGSMEVDVPWWMVERFSDKFPSPRPRHVGG